jgi:hypothetical protein
MSDVRRVDHAFIEQLLSEQLENDRPNFREVARLADCSDWTVRAIWRRMSDDPRPMKGASRPREIENSSLADWLVVACIAAPLVAAVWFAPRRSPQGGAMP